MSGAGTVVGERERGGLRIDPAGGEAGHVLLLFQPAVGGVPQYVADLAEGLGERGWVVTVAAPSQTTVHDRLLDVAHHLVAFDTPRRPAPIADLRISRRLGALCRNGGVDVIHAHSSKAGAIATVVGRLAGVPSVYSPHAWSFQRELPAAAVQGYVAVERILARRHARVIAVADAERSEAELRRVPRPEDIELIHTGIPDRPLPSRETARAELQLDPGAFAVGWVGRMSPQKRPEHVATLATQLAGDATLVTVGYGMPSPQESSAPTEPDPAVIRAADPNTVYAATDAFVLTSRWEAFPLVVLEAMRAGLPVVSYDIGGVREQVVHGVTGLLVSPGDADGLAAGVRELTRDPGLARRMGAAGRRRLLDRFSFGGMVTSIERTYRRVVSTR
jgi:glycosyltransferase involved in cell wall biosynthesis